MEKPDRGVSQQAKNIEILKYSNIELSETWEEIIWEWWSNLPLMGLLNLVSFIINVNKKFWISRGLKIPSILRAEFRAYKQ